MKIPILLIVGLAVAGMGVLGYTGIYRPFNVMGDMKDYPGYFEINGQRVTEAGLTLAGTTAEVRLVGYESYPPSIVWFEVRDNVNNHVLWPPATTTNAAPWTVTVTFPAAGQYEFRGYVRPHDWVADTPTGVTYRIIAGIGVNESPPDTSDKIYVAMIGIGAVLAVIGVAKKW